MPHTLCKFCANPVKKVKHSLKPLSLNGLRGSQLFFVDLFCPLHRLQTCNLLRGCKRRLRACPPYRPLEGGLHLCKVLQTCKLPSCCRPASPPFFWLPQQKFSLKIGGFPGFSLTLSGYWHVFCVFPKYERINTGIFSPADNPTRTERTVCLSSSLCNLRFNP